MKATEKELLIQQLLKELARRAANQTTPEFLKWEEGQE